MTIVIPMWVIWALVIIVGFPAIVFFLMCAWIGFQMIRSDRGFFN